MTEKEVILSILIISHNQKDLLKRCLQSVLQQEISFPYEIIISDDLSTDGTWELIKDYENKYPDLIFGYQINSNDCGPVNNSERCGYNKACAYSRSRGKYFVNIDADDFLIGNDIYQKQVEMLERNPECALCMQNILILNDGDDVSKGQLWFSPSFAKGEFQHGQIITSTEFILNDYFICNPAFVIRKQTNPDPVAIYGKHFDDIGITFHHMQFGKIVYIDRSDYVYVQYKNSLSNSLRGYDKEVIYGLLPLQHALLIPNFAGLFLRSGLKTIKRLVKQKKMFYGLLPETINYLNEFDGFLFRCFSKEELSFNDRNRKKIIYRFTQIIDKFNLHFPVFYKILYVLVIGFAKDKRTNFNIK